MQSRELATYGQLPYRDKVGYTTGFQALVICLLAQCWSNKQTVILGHSKSDGDTPTELINLRNFCSDVSVPRLKLLESQAGVFPGRRFQLQP